MPILSCPEHRTTLQALPTSQKAMPANDIAEILSRLDRLEASLTERHRAYQSNQQKMDHRLNSLEERIRIVEISQARLLAMVTAGGGFGGAIAGAIVLAGKALGIW